MTRATDGKGQATTFEYDYIDRVTRARDAADSLPGTITWIYDGNGNVTSRQDGPRVHGFGYDAFNRRTGESTPTGESLSYGYDPAGNLVSYTDPGGTITYAYNPVNLVSMLTEPGGAQTTFTYNDDYSRTATKLSERGLAARQLRQR